MTLRKLAAMVAALGLIVGLFGAGISAQFTDGATAVMAVNVGTFNINISSTTPNAVVNGDTVTFTADSIQSSAPGTRPFSFTVTSTGTIPASVTVSAVLSGATAAFSDMLGDTGTVHLNQNDSHVYAGGIRWSELGNDDLGRTISITYTVSAAG